MAQDPYTILGVPKDASADDIKKAYRKLAKQYHPDLNPGNKIYEEKFKQVTMANNILSDPQERAKFDRGEIDAAGSAKQYQSANAENPFYYETQQNGGRYSSSYDGVDPDIFESFFRNRGRSAARENPNRAGDDQHYSLQVDFKDSILGAEREITLPAGKKLKITIPPGIESGKKLRLKGLGGAGHGTGPVGDAYVEIQITPSLLFTRSVKNIELEVPVTLAEALVGGEIRVPTLDSPVMVNVPPNSQSGTKLRLRGKGVAATEPSSRGDLIITLKVLLPTSIDSEFKTAVEAWNKRQPYHPREEIFTKEGVS
jgi:DnaJ-class molecular chaperone